MLSKKTDDTSLLFDLKLFSRRKEYLLKKLEKWLLEKNQLKFIYTPNPEQIVQSRVDERFFKVLQKADFLLPDGVGLVVASKFLSLFGKVKPISHRIPGVEVAADLLDMAKENQLDVLVIGGRDYSPDDYFAYEGAKINWTPGFEDVSQQRAKEKRLLEEKIREIKPHLVFVAFGAPAQELWIDQHRDLLSKNGVKVAMAVGGSFDYLLGKVSRAPYWFRKLGLEWLFRLIIEPWRLKRQLRLILFVLLTIKKAIEK